MKIVNIVGARPNMMKMAPLLWEMEKVEEIEVTLIHTGQHYDNIMSNIFFQQLGIRPPDYQLGVGFGTHCYHVAQVMLKLEALLEKIQPDLVLVVGDVNSTLAASLVASKMGIPLAHVEAGLRSFDRKMPEEINRMLTDSISNLLFITEPSGVKNLRREGLDSFLNNGEPLLEGIEELSQDTFRKFSPKTERIGAFVGNVMIDTLLKVKDRAEHEATIEPPEGDYALLTLHRPSNVDDPATFSGIAQALGQVAKDVPILFPCHPRTIKKIREFGLESYFHSRPPSSRRTRDNAILILEPLGYFDFLKLMGHARLVLTDSGGIQEETTILGIPCLTLRENTERPVTLTEGTNILVGVKPQRIITAARNVLADAGKTRTTHPVLWDGHAAHRILAVLQSLNGN